MIDRDIESLLIEEKLLGPAELEKAKDEMRKLKRPLERVVVEMKLVARPALYSAVARRLGFAYTSLEGLQPDPELLKLLPLSLSEQAMAIPVKAENGTFFVAMVEPTDLFSIDQIRLQAGMPVEVFLAGAPEVEEARDKLYAKGGKEDLLANLGQNIAQQSGGASVSEGSSIIKLVDLIIAEAVKDRASDIHIEPEQDLTRIRFRIDGILHEIPSPPKEWEAAIISRIKVLANMDIAESRIPQDGHFQSKLDDKVIDFRVSTMPTIYGENVVLRLLDTASVMIGLEKMGFSTNEQLKRFEDLIARPYGIILTTGPTGSGKTTTLYSSLMRINTVDRNIITIEDPVEYRLGLIRQVQVNTRAGITFANGLRAMLRQDPDVIMVGEIRDLETAIISVQAALTGHLVFSTLHTNDAASAVSRLVNMGVEPFLISASLVGIMAQRLVRRICEHCKEPYEPTKAVVDKWGLKGRKATLYRGKGCDYCKGTGFRGRTGIFELMAVDDELREMVIAGSSSLELRKKSQDKGMKLLSEDGLDKALAGITTVEEVARVCEEHVELRPFPEAVEVQPASPEAPRRPAEQRVRLNESDLTQYSSQIANWLKRK
ncbi:MAG: GspE/PulE family protein [Deltaproteobacteria bacterium]